MSLMPIIIPKVKFTTVGVTFDGTNDYESRAAALVGASNGKKVTISFWHRINAGVITTARIFGLTNHFLLTFGGASSSTGNWSLLGQSTTTTYIQVNSNANKSAGATWHHVCISYDLSVPVCKFYVDGASELNTTTLTAIGANNLDYTSTAGGTPAIGAKSAGSDKLNGDLAEVYVNLVDYLDISVAGNLQKFRSSLGKPVSLGSDGSVPTGSIPAIYVRGPASVFNTNLGSGGDFTVTGTLTNSATSPSD